MALLKRAKFCKVYDENDRSIDCNILDINEENVKETSIKKVTIRFYKLTTDKKAITNLLTYPECKSSLNDADLVAVKFVSLVDIDGYTRDNNNVIGTFYTEILPKFERSKKIYKDDSTNGIRRINQSIDFRTVQVYLFLNRSDLNKFKAISDRSTCSVIYKDETGTTQTLTQVEAVEYKDSERKELREVFDVELTMKYSQTKFNHNQ
jgi:hypothetical protein